MLSFLWECVSGVDSVCSCQIQWKLINFRSTIRTLVARYVNDKYKNNQINVGWKMVLCDINLNVVRCQKRMRPKPDETWVWNDYKWTK